MITRLLIVGSALLLMIATGCKTNQTSVSSTNNNSHPAASTTPDQFASVRGIYEKECKSCHGDTGQGGTVTEKDGSKLKVPTLREGRAVRHDDTEFLKQITKGGDGMPAFDQKLTPEQMNNLIRMIRVEFQSKQ
jgi:mono/diheme cytochrome c family protein